MELKIRTNEFNLFPVFKYSYFHRISFNPDFNINEKGIIESGFVKLKETILNFNLTHFEEVDFKLIVN